MELVSAERPLPGQHMAVFLLYLPVREQRERGRRLSLAFLRRELIPFMRALLS